MIKNSIYIFSLSFFFFSCSGKNVQSTEKDSTPVVSNDGSEIVFPNKGTIAFFRTTHVNNNDINAEYTAPGKISATVLPSQEGASQNIILFENPELAGSYTQLIQHQINISQIKNININQKQIELRRINDLQQHGAATGQDLLNAQTALSMEQSNLANERAALIEHEAKLKSGGFNPEILRYAKAGTAYVICDIPENQIGKMKQGSNCIIQFTAFPDEKFTGKIDDVADVVDNATRMVKLRITLNNSSSKLKAGMFATVSFNLSEGNFISINKNALITIQGNNYVFVKTASNVFKRVAVEAGQEIGDKIVVFSGLHNGDEIAVEGVMQLKGLSFGY